MLSPVPGASRTPPDGRPPAGSAGPSTRGSPGTAPKRQLEQVGPVGPGRRRPVAGAGGVAAVGDERVDAGDPASRQVSQSCGRQTAAVRRAASGSCSASQRSLVTVNDATGTLPTASAHAPGRPARRPGRRPPGPSGCRSTAAPAVTTAPDSSRQTMPCCWPPTLSAATSSSPPRLRDRLLQRRPPGLRDRPRCRPDAAARPWRTSAPVSASRITTLQLWVDESTPATQASSRGRRGGARRRAG